MMRDAKSSSGFVAFWTSLPGVLAGIATLVTILVTAGLIGAESSKSAPPASSSLPTSEPRRTDGDPNDGDGSSSGNDYPPVSITGKECGRSGSGRYAAAAAGNDHTTCPFALNVRKEYQGSGANGAEIRLRVYSPVTKQRYDMDCSGDQPVMCVGGSDALVYLYGGEASFRN